MNNEEVINPYTGKKSIRMSVSEVEKQTLPARESFFFGKIGSHPLSPHYTPQQRTRQKGTSDNE